jgi:hypothetical protein
VKTLKAGKDLAYAVVICKVWKSAIVLYLFVVTSCKWSINLMSIQTPVYNDARISASSHEHTRTTLRYDTRHYMRAL